LLDSLLQETRLRLRWNLIKLDSTNGTTTEAVTKISILLICQDQSFITL